MMSESDLGGLFSRDGTTSMAESAQRSRRRVSTLHVRSRLLAKYAGAVP